MKSLEIKEKITRNRNFNAALAKRKEALIQQGISLSGKTEKNQFDFHVKWVSGDGSIRVGVGKAGKEYYSRNIRWANGKRGNNPNDMRPTIWVNDEEKDFDGSFDHVFNFFQQFAVKDYKSLEILGCLMFRNAFLLDHDEELNYMPPEDAVEYLTSVMPLYDGISVEAYLHYMEMIAWNEDVKYYTLGYDVHSGGVGRKNNMLTYAHIISVLMGIGRLSKLCSSFSRPPIGVAPISIELAKETFKILNIK